MHAFDEFYTDHITLHHKTSIDRSYVKNGTEVLLLSNLQTLNVFMHGTYKIHHIYVFILQSNETGHTKKEIMVY